MSTTRVRVDGEDAVLADVAVDDAWNLVERFSTLVRDSGSKDEQTAIASITAHLDEWGVPYELHAPELLISLPGRAEFVVDGESMRAKTPSMAADTPPEGITAPLVYEATGFATSLEDIFKPYASSSVEVADRIVVCEGQPMGGKTRELEQRGALGVVFVSPGERIHEGIVTTIWGSPDVTSWERKPRIPVVSIARPDGAALIERLVAGEQPMATLVAEHDDGYREIPVLVATIPGGIEPERFVLVHGHVDSWYVGVGDNATGDATLLEVARILWRHRDKLTRSVRVAWWSGHSHGRYAGSTWYAEAFAHDIERNCIAHVNCDSPGCRDADAYESIMWMAEAAEFGSRCVSDFTGMAGRGIAPVRGGDISFNNLGISTLYMLTSHMSQEEVARRGWYGVGGCGGNLEWHAEDDLMHVADPDVLLRDMRLYVGTVLRLASLPVHPFAFGATLAQIEEALKGYEAALGAEFATFERERALLGELGGMLDALAERAAALESTSDARAINDALLTIGRRLVRILYTTGGVYRQETADHVPALPEVARAVSAAASMPVGVIRTDLARSRNRLVGALLECREAVAQVI